MNFTEWNTRTVPFFIEEMVEMQTVAYPSIRQFQQPGIYTPALRAQLVDYIHGCTGIVATSLDRINPYTGKRIMELAYYTDGEVIFNNLLRDYIQRNDFALPASWLALIKQKDFRTGPLAFDAKMREDSEVNIFQTVTQTFQEYPAVKKAMVAPPGQTSAI